MATRGSGSGTAGRPGGASSGGTVVASGRATYGYGGYPGYYPGYYYPDYYPYYGWSWGWYGGCGWWGWPYSAWDWWPYAVASNPTYRVTSGSDGFPAAVETHVQPKRATVLVDGAPVGDARDYNGSWDVLWVTPGRHTLELSAPGYKTLRLALDTQAGARYRVEERLVEGDGLDARSAAASVPVVGSSGSSEAEPTPGAEPRVTDAMPRSTGLHRALLRVDITPADAAVYLDGEFLARADELERLHGALPVAEGVHTLDAVRPGFVSRSVRVDVTGETPVRVEFALEREAR